MTEMSALRKDRACEKHRQGTESKGKHSLGVRTCSPEGPDPCCIWWEKGLQPAHLPRSPLRQYGPAFLAPHLHHVSGPTLAQTWRLVTVSRRASSEREATGTTKGLSGMCSSLNLMETS